MKGDLADLAANRGDWAGAETLNREALLAFEALGDRQSVAVSQGKLADLAANRGDWAGAETLRQAVLAEYEALGDRRSVAVGQGKLADLAAKRGDWAGAETLNREALALYRALGALWEEAVRSYNFAQMQYQRGLIDEAISLMERVVELERHLHHPDLPADQARLDQWKCERDGGEPSEEEQFAAAMQALKAIYDQSGPDAVREQLRAANVPDAVIEQIIGMLGQ
jgi:tetratricopeptide (TPR) repeat protein